MIISLFILLLIGYLAAYSPSHLARLRYIVLVDFFLCFTFNLYLTKSGDINSIGSSYFLIILLKDFIICCTLFLYCLNVRSIILMILYGSSMFINTTVFIEYTTTSNLFYSAYGITTRLIEIIQLIILVEWLNAYRRVKDYICGLIDYIFDDRYYSYLPSSEKFKG